MAEFVSVQSSGGLATIRLDRPPVNALSIALQGELRDAAEQVSADPDIRAVVIYGGEKVFAAGAGRDGRPDSFRAVAGIGKPGGRSRTTTGMPATADTSAMPAPMSPPPTTPTELISRGMAAHLRRIGQISCVSSQLRPYR